MLPSALSSLLVILAVSPTAAPNTLSPQEKKAGWRLLFDGKTTKGWRGFKSDTMPDGGWLVGDGMLRRVAGGEKVGDIVTIEQFESFELMLEWRIPPAGNSGIKYPVDESMVTSGRSGLGFEYQILDNAGHPDAKQGKGGNRTSGALYDLIAPKVDVVREPGRWNESKILIHGSQVEHWLNGKKLLEFELGSPALKALIGESKYKAIPRFGEIRKGHILLQDHGDGVDFRNIKVRLPQK